METLAASGVQWCQRLTFSTCKDVLGNVKKLFFLYSHLASELWGQSSQSLRELSVIFASSVGEEQEVGRHLGVEQTYSRLRRKEEKRTQRDSHWDWLGPGAAVWPEASLLWCFVFTLWQHAGHHAQELCIMWLWRAEKKLHLNVEDDVSWVV